MITTMTLQLVVLALGATSMLLLIVAAPPPPPPLPPASSCTDELVLFSPCLPYVLSPPNNLSNTASVSCCDAFSSVLNSNNGVCLCYLVRQPSILRFPVNNTRVLSFSSVCPIGEDITVPQILDLWSHFAQVQKAKPSSWFLKVLSFSW